jgi:hypothetical protein
LCGILSPYHIEDNNGTEIGPGRYIHAGPAPQCNSAARLAIYKHRRSSVQTLESTTASTPLSSEIHGGPLNSTAPTPVHARQPLPHLARYLLWLLVTHGSKRGRGMAPRISDRAHLLCFLDSDTGHLIDTRGGARKEDYAARLHTPIAKDLIEGRGEPMAELCALPSNAARTNTHAVASLSKSANLCPRRG